MNIVEIGRLPGPRVAAKQSGLGRGAIAAAKLIGGGIAGNAFARLENKAYMPSGENSETVRQIRNMNEMIGTLSGAALGTAGRKFVAPILSQYPMKAVAAGIAAHHLNMQQSVADKNLQAAGAMRDAGQAGVSAAKWQGVAAGTIIAGIVGAMGYDYWKMRRQEKKRTGMIRVTLPTSRQDAESKVDIPLAALPEETYKGVLRDTRRRLRSEVEERKMRRGQAAAALRDGADVINRMSEPAPAKG